MSLQFSDETVATKFIELCENVSTIKSQLETLPELRATVAKHDRVYNIGKVAAVPALGLFHVGFKHFLTKIGW